MRKPHQFSIAALMTLVLCSAVVAALVRHPDTRTVLIEMATGSLMFVLSASLIYFCFWCIYLVIWLFRRIRSRKWSSKRGSVINNPSLLIGD